MFDNDDLFDLQTIRLSGMCYSMTMSWSRTVENGRIRMPRVTRRKSKTSAAVDCSAGSLDNCRIAASVYLARVEHVAK